MDRRGAQLEHTFLDDTRVMMRYRLPLGRSPRISQTSSNRARRVGDRRRFFTHFVQMYAIRKYCSKFLPGGGGEGGRGVGLN